MKSGMVVAAARALLYCGVANVAEIAVLPAQANLEVYLEPGGLRRWAAHSAVMVAGAMHAGGAMAPFNIVVAEDAGSAVRTHGLETGWRAVDPAAEDVR